MNCRLRAAVSRADPRGSRNHFRPDRDGFNLLKNLTVRTASVFCKLRNCFLASPS